MPTEIKLLFQALLKLRCGPLFILATLHEKTAENGYDPQQIQRVWLNSAPSIFKLSWFYVGALTFFTWIVLPFYAAPIQSVTSQPVEYVLWIRAIAILMLLIALIDYRYNGSFRQSLPLRSRDRGQYRILEEDSFLDIKYVDIRMIGSTTLCFLCLLFPERLIAMTGMYTVMYLVLATLYIKSGPVKNFCVKCFLGQVGLLAILIIISLQWSPSAAIPLESLQTLSTLLFISIFAHHSLRFLTNYRADLQETRIANVGSFGEKDLGKSDLPSDIVVSSGATHIVFCLDVVSLQTLKILWLLQSAWGEELRDVAEIRLRFLLHKGASIQEKHRLHLLDDYAMESSRHSLCDVEALLTSPQGTASSSREAVRSADLGFWVQAIKRIPEIVVDGRAISQNIDASHITAFQRLACEVQSHRQ